MKKSKWEKGDLFKTKIRRDRVGEVFKVNTFVPFGIIPSCHIIELYGGQIQKVNSTMVEFRCGDLNTARNILNGLRED